MGSRPYTTIKNCRSSPFSVFQVVNRFYRLIGTGFFLIQAIGSLLTGTYLYFTVTVN